MARCFDAPAIAATGPAAGLECPVCPSGTVGLSDVRPGDHRAAIPAICGVGLQNRSGFDEGGGGLVDAGIGVLPTAADQHFTPTVAATGGQVGVVIDQDVCARGHDSAAHTALRGRRIERACDRDQLAFTQQSDLTLFARGKGARFDDARVVDDAGTQAADGLGREIDHAAIGLDGAALFDQCVERASLHLQFHRPTQIQRDLGTRAQQHIALRGTQATGIDDLAGNQGHGAALSGLDVALVHDGRAREGVACVAVKPVVARHEVGRADLQRGSDNRADVDLGCGREQHAVGVDQEHLAVGTECPLNHRYVIAQNAVECHGAGRGLHKIDGIASPNAEALPIGSHALAALVDGHHTATLADVACAGHDGPTRGQLRMRQAAHQGGAGHGQPCAHCAATAAFTSPASYIDSGRWAAGCCHGSRGCTQQD